MEGAANCGTDTQMKTIGRQVQDMEIKLLSSPSYHNPQTQGAILTVDYAAAPWILSVVAFNFRSRRSISVGHGPVEKMLRQDSSSDSGSSELEFSDSEFSNFFMSDNRSISAESIEALMQVRLFRPKQAANSTAVCPGQGVSWAEAAFGALAAAVFVTVILLAIRAWRSRARLAVKGVRSQDLEVNTMTSRSCLRRLNACVDVGGGEGQALQRASMANPSLEIPRWSTKTQQPDSTVGAEPAEDKQPDEVPKLMHSSTAPALLGSGYNRLND